MRKIIKLSLLLFLLLMLTSAQPAWARLGVGVNVGNIKVNEPLLSGGIYPVTKISVLNTGTESSDYGVGVSYRENQKEMKPPEEWFRFSPEKFELDQGEAQPVSIDLVIPVNAKAGDYFALVEGHPITKGKGLTIGIAAASKIRFTVKSSTLFWSILNRLTTWFENNMPYSAIAVGILLLAIVILVARRYLNISFRVEKKGK
jgi:hypothetical protein